MALTWHQQASLSGIRVKASFFDSRRIEDEPDQARRVLPFLGAAGLKTISTEGDRQNFRCGQLVAQPDVVFEHGYGLISVEYKSVGGRSHAREAWQQSIRLKDMLQCLIAGYAVAQTHKKTTACVLRYHNVCYLLTPDPKVIHTMLDLVPMAMKYYSEEKAISATQLAQFSMDRIQSLFRDPNDSRAAAGRAAHDTLLRGDKR